MTIIAVVVRRHGLELARARIDLTKLRADAELDSFLPHRNLIFANRLGDLPVAETKHLRLAKEIGIQYGRDALLRVRSFCGRAGARPSRTGAGSSHSNANQLEESVSAISG